MDPLDLVKLTPLMQRTGGRPEVRVALIDGPVAMDHPDLAGQNVRQIANGVSAQCSRTSSVACTHGTFVAGILLAKRTSSAPAICPDCTLLVRPIFPEIASRKCYMPSAKPEELASALIDTVNAGARVVNLSAALAHPSAPEVGAALDYAGRRNVIVVAAAGNQGTMGSSTITRHPWVIPVTGCDLQGRPTPESNMGNSIGRNGLMGPARDVTSLGTDNNTQTSDGTSAAAPFVTGTIALLWSEFPSAPASVIKLAIRGGNVDSRRTIVPPLLNAWAAYQTAASLHGRSTWR
jgi:subtilisin family serine protease